MVWGCPGAPPWDSSSSEGLDGRTAQWGLEGAFCPGGLEAWPRDRRCWQRLGAGGAKGVQDTESHRLGSFVPTAQNVTVDEVVSAYKQACQKLSCRQIPKLLRQLQVCQEGVGGAF